MIATALRRYFEAERFRGLVAAYLFGSEAEQRGHRESDIDVGVLVDRSVSTSPAARSRLRVDLSSALIGVTGRERVDVIILNDAPPELGRHIVVRGTRLFSSDAAAVHAFERDVQLRAADIAPFLERMRRIKLEWLAR
jgi:predicted nucleotidyltransferase